MSFTEIKHSLRLEPLNDLKANPEYVRVVDAYNHAGKNILAFLDRNPYFGSEFMEKFIAECKSFVVLIREGKDDESILKEKDAYELVAGEGIIHQEFVDFNTLFGNFKNATHAFLSLENGLLDEQK